MTNAVKILSPRVEAIATAASEGNRHPLDELWAEIAKTGGPLFEPTDDESMECVVFLKQLDLVGCVGDKDYIVRGMIVPRKGACGGHVTESMKKVHHSDKSNSMARGTGHLHLKNLRICQVRSDEALDLLRGLVAVLESDVGAPTRERD